MAVKPGLVSTILTLLTLLGDTLVPLKETSFRANLPTCDLSPQRPRGVRWLRWVAHPDNCGQDGSPLPQAGAPAATTSRAGRRYVMRDGYAIG
jgi:hypothetical protein